MKNSIMGSSKYEFEPDLFEKDIKSKLEIYNIFKNDLKQVMYKEYKYHDGQIMSDTCKREIVTKVFAEFINS